MPSRLAGSTPAGPKLASPKLAGQPVIAGGGLAGLSVALHMDGPCIVLTPTPLGTDAASSLAQGGIAAALGPGDSPALHAADTLAAGAGLCDPDVVRAMTEAAPNAVQQLADWGVAFDRRTDGSFDLHLEAAHSHPRIAHGWGDRSGAAIMDALIRRIRETPRITVLEGASLEAVHAPEGRVEGVWIRHGGHDSYLPTGACVIASGGVGALYTEATSPRGNTGRGLAVAIRAGAALGDMEFVQFHPTALDTGRAGQRPLISEAVRGAGAVLIDETGARFTEELAPRDVVARAIAAHRRAGHRVFLDARLALGAKFAAHFPGITQVCRAEGIDPATMPIPVAPAVHYHMGGIAVDGHGRSTLAGLWACGEAACTGLHGANRLASNSLLEAFVTGRNVAGDIANHPLSTTHSPALSPPTLHQPPLHQHGDVGRLMSAEAGLLRDEAGLTRLLNALAPRVAMDDHALIGALIAQAAWHRRESRGSHWRSDFPQTGLPQRFQQGPEAVGALCRMSEEFV